MIKIIVVGFCLETLVIFFLCTLMFWEKNQYHKIIKDLTSKLIAKNTSEYRSIAEIDIKPRVKIEKTKRTEPYDETLGRYA